MAVSEHIRHVQIDDVIVLLDIRAGRYLLIEDVAAEMWDGLCRNRTPEQIVDDISTRYDAARDQVAQDFAQFLASCRANGYWDDAPAAPALPVVPHSATSFAAGRHFLTLRAWLALLASWMTLKTGGFHGLHGAAQRLAAMPRGAGQPDAQLLQRAEAAFLRAENFFILKSAPQDCLPRSMAMYRFLHGLGLPVRHRIEVERYPLTMHAWVECDGEPVLNDPDAGRMTVIATTGA